MNPIPAHRATSLPRRPAGGRDAREPARLVSVAAAVDPAAALSGITIGIARAVRRVRQACDLHGRAAYAGDRWSPLPRAAAFAGAVRRG